MLRIIMVIPSVTKSIFITNTLALIRNPQVIEDVGGWLYQSLVMTTFYSSYTAAHCKKSQLHQSYGYRLEECYNCPVHAFEMFLETWTILIFSIWHAHSYIYLPQEM